MNTAIVVFLYIRNKNFDIIFDKIRAVRPAKLFLIGDGAKNSAEAVKVKQVQDHIARLIDWPCKVHKNYAKSNMGLKERFSTGITWVFEHVDQAIFIEDDCIPDVSFFRFCEELLVRYRDNPRIMTIAGNNFQSPQSGNECSYYFSRYPRVWGWATWKRAWDTYDPSITDWPILRETDLVKNRVHNFIIVKFWKYIFDRVYRGVINTWDYQLTYASFKNNGLSIIPSVNLVTNVGYDADSTNIKHKNMTNNVPILSATFPLKHSTVISADEVADRHIDNLVYLHPVGKLSLAVKSILGIL